MKHSHLQSILTAAIVDYCQNNDLYLAELHIQGTVCISSDGAPTLVTQLSEKVCTSNNNRLVRTHPPPSPSRPSDRQQDQRSEDHRPEDDELLITRYDHPGSKSPLRKHRRKSDPGHRSRYGSDFHRDFQNYRWSVDSIPETVTSKYPSSSLSDERHRREVSPEREQQPHHIDHAGPATYMYRTPKEEPLDPSHKHVQQQQQHPDLHDKKQQPLHPTGLPEERPESRSSREDERLSTSREAGVQEMWRMHREQAVSAAALAVYNYMHSPTYHSADLRSGGLSSHGHSLQLGPRKEPLEEDRAINQQTEQQQQHQQQHIPGSSSGAAGAVSTHSTSVSGIPLSSPPPPSPRTLQGRSDHHSLAESHSQSTVPHPLRSPSYPQYRPSRDLPLSLPLDYAQHCSLTSPTSIKSEKDAREELHVVTRPLAPHVPGMISPSAQAAASAMAALSSLQASIMPSGTPPQATKSSPESAAGRSASTSSGHSQAEEPDMESPPPEEMEPETSISPESPVPEAAAVEVTGMTATGCIQIPDAPVNSHFRKMMLKSLQGKYKVLKTPEGRYKCPVCGVSYVYQPNLRKHLEKVHLGKSYKCEFCGQKFTSVQGYSFHRKVKHRDLMPYRCELCRDAFYSYTAFLQHKKRSHSNHPECTAITHDQNLNSQKQRQAAEAEKQE